MYTLHLHKGVRVVSNIFRLCLPLTKYLTDKRTYQPGENCNNIRPEKLGKCPTRKCTLSKQKIVTMSNLKNYEHTHTTMSPEILLIVKFGRQNKFILHLVSQTFRDNIQQRRI